MTAKIRACFQSETALGMIGVGVVLLSGVPIVTDIVLLNVTVLLLDGSPTFGVSLLTVTREFPSASLSSGEFLTVFLYHF